MNDYELTFIGSEGEVTIEVITADTLKEAKEICKTYYHVKKFIYFQGRK